MFHRVVIGYDGSAGSRAALHAALEINNGSPAQVSAIIVQHHLPRYGATVGEVDEERDVEAATARRLNSEIQAIADEHAASVITTVVPGHPAEELVRAANDLDADLIVLGHSGHSAIRHHLLGSITEKVSRHAQCCVLIVR